MLKLSSQSYRGTLARLELENENQARTITKWHKDWLHSACWMKWKLLKYKSCILGFHCLLELISLTLNHLRLKRDIHCREKLYLSLPGGKSFPSPSLPYFWLCHSWITRSLLPHGKVVIAHSNAITVSEVCCCMNAEIIVQGFFS